MGKPTAGIDIEDLPAPARTALKIAINERKPALAKRSSDYYILAILAGIALSLYAILHGYGEPYSASQEADELVFYVVGFGMIALGVISGRNKKALKKLFGFAPGVYVLGSRMVDARTRELKVKTLLDMQ